MADDMGMFSMEALLRVAEVGAAAQAEIDRRTAEDAVRCADIAVERRSGAVIIDDEPGPQVTTPPPRFTPEQIKGMAERAMEGMRTPEEKMDSERDDILRGIFG